ncbi:MAG: hypothetical protein RLZZ303_3447, partial [Candidatus Hydrogenedentota bacterium]
YGFVCLWVIGFLWAGLGGAGTALPAALTRARLTGLFVPLGWIFAGWLVLSVVLLPGIEQWESSTAATWSRHESPLYWFDSDWLQAVGALAALALYDLWTRRARLLPTPWLLMAALAGLALPLLLGMDNIAAVGILAAVMTVIYLAAGAPLMGLLAYAAAFALLGSLIHGALYLTGLTRLIVWLLVWPQGDLVALRALTEAQGIPYEAAVSELLINWPQFFKVIPQHLGWMIGAIGGVVLYFRRYGRFERDAGLFVAMASGWLLAFILLPTLFNFGGAGLRMTPPRGDDWAGILGVFLAAMWWLRRHNAVPVVYAALISGAIGGLAFSGAAALKLMMTALGNPAITTNPELVAVWAHYQGSNWHSFLEQSYGLFNGIGIAVAMGLLSRRGAALSDRPRTARGTAVLATAFVLFGVLFLNMFKNVPEWVRTKLVPETMTAPWFDTVTLSAGAWFVLIYLAVACSGMLLMAAQLRRPIAMLPESSLGRAQLLYLLFLWSVCVMNYERALPGFAQGRLLTEGVILINAAIASMLILLVPRMTPWPAPAIITWNYAPPIRRAILLVLTTIILAASLTIPVRLVYGDSAAGHASVMKRFGPDATWRKMPLIRGEAHR